MFANSTWLHSTIQNDKPCIDGIHIQFGRNVIFTFGGHRMGDRNTHAFINLTLKISSNQNMVNWGLPIWVGPIARIF